MFVLEVEYLTGRAVATARHDRNLVEWPPHPGRLFAALVAACHEADLTDAEREAGRAALRWLETLPPPALSVTPASRRDLVTTFVPVNDTNDQYKVGAKGKVTILPAICNGEVGYRRDRQPRAFPSVTPQQPVAYFLWREADADGFAKHRPSLTTLAAHLTYLGHSSSLVRAAVCDGAEEVTPTYEPAGDGQHVFRIPTKGRLYELERAYARQARPSPGTYQAYRQVGPSKPAGLTPAESMFGDLIVCQLVGPSLPLSGTLRLTTAVRDAMIEHTDRANARVRELLSGHTPEGGVTAKPHVAYIPLPFVGHRHADGLIKGFALVLPRGLGRFNPDRRDILRAMVNLEVIQFGAQGPWRVSIPTAGEGPTSLRGRPYVGAARAWATVTPVLCDRFPKEKDGQRVEDVIRESCRRVVGIDPVRIQVGKVSWHPGVPPSHDFGRIRKPGDTPRHRHHVYLEFDRPVRGPVLLGAGRFAGLGLFRVWGGREGGR